MRKPVKVKFDLFKGLEFTLVRTGLEMSLHYDFFSPQPVPDRLLRERLHVRVHGEARGRGVRVRALGLPLQGARRRGKGIESNIILFSYYLTCMVNVITYYTRSS